MCRWDPLEQADLVRARVELARELRRAAVSLADDVVVGRALDDILDVGNLVAGANEEERAVLSDSLVLGQRHLDAVGAGVVSALAQDREPLARDLERLRNLLDPLVHLTKERLVDADPPLAFVDAAILV
jgi:hypothetical protein